MLSLVLVTLRRDRAITRAAIATVSEITYRPHARRIGQSYYIYAQDFDLNGDHLKNQIIGGGLLQV